MPMKTQWVLLVVLMVVVSGCTGDTAIPDGVDIRVPVEMDMGPSEDLIQCTTCAQQEDCEEGYRCTEIGRR